MAVTGAAAGALAAARWLNVGSLAEGRSFLSTHTTLRLRLHYTPIVSRRARPRSRSCTVCELAKLSDVEPKHFDKESTSDLPSLPGIYAIYDKQGELQFVGLSRKLSSSIQTHFRDVPQLCSSFKVAIVNAPDRTQLTEAWEKWVQEHVEMTGNIPPGNSPGNTVWSSRKRGVKNDIRLMPRSDTKLTIPLVDLIDKVVKENEVVVFIKGSRSSPQCGFSHRVLTILDELGVNYETLNVLDEEHNPGLREAIKAYSQWPTIPQVFVKGEIIGGADILNEMVESGDLKNLFKK